MEDAIAERVNELLRRMQEGDRDALDELMGLVYAELKDMARSRASRFPRPGGGDNTLSATALVHEFYLKLRQREKNADKHQCEPLVFDSKGRFFAYAATAITHGLISYAEARVARLDRELPAGLRRLQMEEETPDAAENVFTMEQLARLRPALDRLGSIDSRLRTVFEMKYSLGMSFTEIGEAIAVSPETARKDYLEALETLRDELDVPELDRC